MILAIALLVAIGSVVWYVWHLFHWDETRLERADTRPASWFQLATYSGGRVSHLTPMHNGLHTEDEHGECACLPSAGPYRTEDDRAGVLYVHHVLDDRFDRALR